MPSEIQPGEMAAWIGQVKARVIDCREPDETAICMLPGAECLPLTRWAELAPERFTDPAQPLLIYCHHGVRSMSAARWLEARGFREVRSLAGGIDRWAIEIEPTMARY